MVNLSHCVCGKVEFSQPNHAILGVLPHVIVLFICGSFVDRVVFRDRIGDLIPNNWYCKIEFTR